MTRYSTPRYSLGKIVVNPTVLFILPRVGYLITSFCFAIFCSGCFLLEGPKTQPNLLPSETVFIHTVNFKGESLPLIAEWYTGEGKNWSKFKSYNGEIKRLYNLKLGSQIRIPQHLMIRHDQITSEFVQDKQKSYLARARKSSVIPKVTPTQTAIVQQPEKIEEKLDSETQDELIENLLLSDFPPDSTNP